MVVVVGWYCGGDVDMVDGVILFPVFAQEVLVDVLVGDYLAAQHTSDGRHLI